MPGLDLGIHAESPSQNVGERFTAQQPHRFLNLDWQSRRRKMSGGFRWLSPGYARRIMDRFYVPISWNT